LLGVVELLCEVELLDAVEVLCAAAVLDEDSEDEPVADVDDPAREDDFDDLESVR
jgi:hypothetical protein